MMEAVWFESGCQWAALDHGVIALLGFGRQDDPIARMSGDAATDCCLAKHATFAAYLHMAMRRVTSRLRRSSTKAVMS